MAVSFQTDILPLFTQMDIDHMQDMGVQLNNYDYMRDPSNAQDVYSQVSQGLMPPPGSGEDPWSPQQVNLFQTWMDEGYPP
jgi:hypothetical protein